MDEINIHDYNPSVILRVMSKQQVWKEKACFI